MKPWLPLTAESSAGLAARTDCSLAAKHPASAGLLLAAVAGAPSVPSVAQSPETSALGFASERRGAAALRLEPPCPCRGLRGEWWTSGPCALRLPSLALAPPLQAILCVSLWSISRTYFGTREQFMGYLETFEVPGAILFAPISISDSHSRRAALRAETGPCVPV
jgi:hypothetical protein